MDTVLESERGASPKECHVDAEIKVPHFPLAPDWWAPIFARQVKNSGSALDFVSQWVECQPMNQRVTGSMPSQGTRLGCGLGPH